MSEETLFARTDETHDEFLYELQEKQVEKYLIFLAGGIRYGVHVDYVAEIITQMSITQLPLLPDHISGVINLRGQIVPILDFRRLLGLAQKAEPCTIVLDIGEVKTGILVDEVDQMANVETEQILPVPYQSQQQSQKLVCGMYSLPDGGSTLMLLDCPLLLYGQQ